MSNYQNSQFSNYPGFYKDYSHSTLTDPLYTSPYYNQPSYRKDDLVADHPPPPLTGLPFLKPPPSQPSPQSVLDYSNSSPYYSQESYLSDTIHDDPYSHSNLPHNNSFPHSFLPQTPNTQTPNTQTPNTQYFNEFQPHVITYNIYVGGLPENVSENDLKRAFSECGNIYNATIIRDLFTGHSKGFGFVNFIAKESRDYAITRYKEIKIRGSRCKVKLHLEGLQKIKLEYLPHNTDREKLIQHVTSLSHHNGLAPFLQLDYIPENHLAFLYYDFNQDALKAQNILHRSVINGTMIDASIVSRSQNSTLTSTVYIRDLPLDVTQPELKDFFSYYGHVVSTRIAYDRSNNPLGYGFVEYDTNVEAQRAIASVNNTEYRGHILVVQIDHPNVLKKKKYENETYNSFRYNEPHRRDKPFQETRSSYPMKEKRFGKPNFKNFRSKRPERSENPDFESLDFVKNPRFDNSGNNTTASTESSQAGKYKNESKPGFLERNVKISDNILDDMPQIVNPKVRKPKIGKGRVVKKKKLNTIEIDVDENNEQKTDMTKKKDNRKELENVNIESHSTKQTPVSKTQIDTAEIMVYEQPSWKPNVDNIPDEIPKNRPKIPKKPKNIENEVNVDDLYIPSVPGHHDKEILLTGVNPHPIRKKNEKPNRDFPIFRSKDNPF